MNSKTLKNGFSIPNLGLGCWPMGGFKLADIQEYEMVRHDDEKDISAIHSALDSGVTHFDTAEVYADGHSEEVLCEAIKNHDRSKLILASKVAGGSKATRFKDACEASLKRVGVDYFDLYYIHWREDEDDLKTQIHAMEELKDAGLIKNIGVSNFNSNSLKKAQELCKYPIVANQVHYNLIFREPEKDGLVEYCQQNDVMLVAYRPVELGKLANASNSLVEFAAKYKKTRAQIALNWLISQKNVVAIFGGSNTDYIMENLGAGSWEMSQEDIEKLRQNYGGQIFESDCVPLE